MAPIDDLVLAEERNREVIRLREWGTDNIYTLPRPPVRHCLVGTSKMCELRLRNLYISPRQAILTYCCRAGLMMAIEAG
jgi:hypothetical protein